jgi:hypothetical protein
MKREAFSPLIKAALDKLPPDAAPAYTVDPGVLPKYAGNYGNAASGLTMAVTVQNGALMGQVQGQPQVRLVPTAENVFRVVEVNATLTFNERGGLVESIGLAQGPVTLTLARITAEATPPPAAAAETTPPPAMLPPGRIPRATGPRNWPSFRGDASSGNGDGQRAITDWDTASGTNIKWKTPIPGIANSSPIVWGNRVIAVAAASADDTSFRTGLYGDVAPVENLSRHTWRVHALDLHTGKELWRREVFGGTPRTKRHTKSSQANATPVTDGRHIVAVFGAIGQIVCYDMDGTLLWKKDVGALDSGWFLDPTYQWGHASSPVIYRSSVIVQADQARGSFLAAFGIADGRELWRTPRTDEVSTWGTPTVLSGPKGDELVTNGTKIRGYDPATGALLWTLAPNSEIAIGSPVVRGNVAYVTGGYPPVRPVYAVRAGARGDISLPPGRSSSEAIAWSHDRDGTYISTPIVYRDQLYTLNNNGVLTAYAADTGERLFRARVGGGGAFSASPVAADGRLYMANEDGDVVVAQAGRQYVELAKHSMGEVIMATPAISDGVIVVRTLGHIWGIGQVPAAGSPRH